MAVTAYCPTCRRVVYVGRGDSDGCPVCSTPLDADGDDGGTTLAEQRAARNENIFRGLNEGRVMSTAAPPGAEIELLCECSAPDCSERVAVERHIYEQIRSNPVRFLMRPDHDAPGIEVPVFRRDGYIVVEKTGKSGTIAEQGDPRS